MISYSSSTIVATATFPHDLAPIFQTSTLLSNATISNSIPSPNPPNGSLIILFSSYTLLAFLGP